jgi:hypothetical protein
MTAIRLPILYNPSKRTLSTDPKAFQEYEWRCNICHGLKSARFLNKFTQYESKRHGSTSGMRDHLSIAHGITKESHEGRIRGYTQGKEMGAYTENTSWSSTTKKHQNRLSRKEATRRWFVKTRQPFKAVEAPEFQEMFLAYNTQCAYRSRTALRNDIFGDFKARRAGLKAELAVNCASISITLDMWTSPNRIPIFAIIGHWITPTFQEREEVLEFIQVKGSHTGEALAKVVLALIQELGIEQRLYAITGDNASNNGT